MISFFGNSLIFLSIVLTITIIYFSFKEIKGFNLVYINKIKTFVLSQTTFVLMSFFTLMSAYLISDFSLVNVYQNSHSSKPLFYKISGVWGNHEGSLLLWINILVLFSFIFFISNSNKQKIFKLYTLITQNFLVLGFLIFLFLTSNPFSLVVPTPTDGLGLNPILQDPALAIHPPLLYLGFVGSSIFFSAAIASLLSGVKGKEFASSIKFWVLLTWVFQTLGILVGSIWAYYELGWGGFWFWDPVENASLLPWFSMTALMHSIILLEKKKILYNWVVFLCLLTFSLSVMGTFLVRSGILNSVHTFASDPSRGIYILSFLIAMVLISISVLLKKTDKEKLSENTSKLTFILINNWFMIFFLVTVLVGTIFPIFSEVLSNAKISVGPPYYNSILIPVIIPFLFFMALGPKFKIYGKLKNQFKEIFIILFLAILVNLLIIKILGKPSLLTNLIVISSLFLIFNSFIDFSKYFNTRKINYAISRTISHLGFGLLLLFIGLSENYSFEREFNLKVGEKAKFNKYEIEFKNLKVENFNNYKAVIGEFNILNIKKNSINGSYPEIRIYNNPKTTTYEASIGSNIIRDYFMTISKVDDSDFYNIRFQNKPFMLMIWFSAFLIALGGISRIFLRS
tara:strand:- start:535 stop:2412 length:1878 start_codon:yes stop_codon:yes gene_type:complete